MKYLSVRDNRTYVQFTKFPENMLLFDNKGEELNPLAPITTNVTFKCDTERGYMSTGSTDQIHTQSWGTRLLFVPANGSTPAFLLGESYELFSGDLTGTMGPCSKLLQQTSTSIGA